MVLLNVKILLFNIKNIIHNKLILLKKISLVLKNYLILLQKNINLYTLIPIKNKSLNLTNKYPTFVQL